VLASGRSSRKKACRRAAILPGVGVLVAEAPPAGTRPEGCRGAGQISLREGRSQGGNHVQHRSRAGVGGKNMKFQRREFQKAGIFFS